MAGQLRLLSGATALQTEAIDLQKEASTWAESFKLFQQVGQVAGQVQDKEAKVKNMVDAHQAKQDAAILNQALSNQSGTDRRASYEGVLGDITRQFERGEISSGYYQGYMGAIEGKYTTALADQQTEYNNAVGETAGSEFMAGVEAGVAGDATVYIDNVANDTGVPKAVIRDGVLTGVFSNYDAKINEATTQEEVDAIVKQFNNVKVTSLDSTNLLKTRSKELSAKIKQLETNVANTIKRKEAQFKYESGQRVSQAIGSVDNPLEQYNKTPEEVDRDLVTLYGDKPITLQSKRNEYLKGYNEHDEARRFTASTSVDESVSAGKVKGNETLNKHWTMNVQKEFQERYVRGDMVGSVSIANNQAAFLGEVGNDMYNIFTSINDSSMLAEFLQKDELFRTTQGGNSAYNNLYSKEQRQTILMTGIAVDTLGIEDPYKARALVFEAQNSTAKPMLPISLRGKFQDKRRADLGSAYNDYLTDLNVVNKLSGSDIMAAEKKLYEHYKNRDVEKGNTVVSTKYGTPPVYTDEVEEQFYGTIETLIASANVDPDTTELVVSPTGDFIVQDKVFGTSMFTINTKEVEQLISDAITNKEPAGPLERILRSAGETSIAKAAKLQEGITEATSASVANITNKQGTLTFNLGTNIMLGLVKFFMGSDDIEASASSNNPVDSKYITADRLQREQANTVFKANFVSDDITQKIADVESGNDYTAFNKRSGAYGKYQFLPSTLKEYADKLNISEEKAKTPEGQEKVFDKLRKDNEEGLKEAGIPIDAFSIYGSHQQGLKGFKEIIEGKTLSEKRINNMKSNLPGGHALNDLEVRDAWIAYWKDKML